MFQLEPADSFEKVFSSEIILKPLYDMNIKNNL